MSPLHAIAWLTLLFWGVFWFEIAVEPDHHAKGWWVLAPWILAPLLAVQVLFRWPL